jgi:hypothetical protein
VTHARSFVLLDTKIGSASDGFSDQERSEIH